MTVHAILPRGGWINVMDAPWGVSDLYAGQVRGQGFRAGAIGDVAAGARHGGERAALRLLSSFEAELEMGYALIELFGGAREVHVPQVSQLQLELADLQLTNGCEE
jgi:hypothetical protein